MPRARNADYMWKAGFDIDFEVVEWGSMLVAVRRPPDAPAGKGVDAIKLQPQLHDSGVDEAPWVWIVHDLNPRAMSPKVEGFHPAQSWFEDFTSVYYMD
jgi:peptide/nickel transport system substrate-binding protein